MTDFSTKQGSVSAGTDFPADGPFDDADDMQRTGFNDGPKGEQVPKGPGAGISANGKRIH